MNPYLSIDTLRNCLEGVIPAGVATCSRDLVPNVSYVSQVMYVDQDHIALSFQFFNKTRENILANPLATVLMVDPDTAARYRMKARYLRTETQGPLFERMKARLAGIASHEGLVGVFRLRGTDVYRILDIEAVPGAELPRQLPGRAILPALRQCSERLHNCSSLEDLVNNLLDALDRSLGLSHSMLLIADRPGAKLYVVASRGYPSSGIGAEIPLGVGVIGIAAREQVPIRIMFTAAEYAYTRAVREQAIAEGLVDALEQVINLPGLNAPSSQMAIPLPGIRGLIGVLYTESQQECRFSYDIEDALVTLCAQAGLAIQGLQLADEPGLVTPPPDCLCIEDPLADASPDPLRVEYHDRDHSVFIDGDYLIKGVAGAVLWRILNDYSERGRVDFSNRELRLDSRLGLPEISDNLEARLILLSRRLQERSPFLRIEKTGRGRFRLLLQRPLVLVPMNPCAAPPPGGISQPAASVDQA
jgi:adenylate cyclase